MPIFRKNKAVSTIEYLGLVILIVAAFMLMRKYILQGIVGRWKNVGDSFGYGMLYDSDYTEECALYSYPQDQNLEYWYNVADYDACLNRPIDKAIYYTLELNQCKWNCFLKITNPFDQNDVEVPDSCECKDLPQYVEGQELSVSCCYEYAQMQYEMNCAKLNPGNCERKTAK